MRLYDQLKRDRVTRSDFPELGELLNECAWFQADRIARYYFAENPKEHWELSDFPDLRPFFGNMFIEWRMPHFANSEGAIIPTPPDWNGQLVGIQFSAVDLNAPEVNTDRSVVIGRFNRKRLVMRDAAIPIGEARRMGCRWQVLALPCIGIRRTVSQLPGYWIMMIRNDGSVGIDPDGAQMFGSATALPTESPERWQDMSPTLLYPALLTLSLLRAGLAEARWESVAKRPRGFGSRLQQKRATENSLPDEFVTSGKGLKFSVVLPDLPGKTSLIGRA